MPGRTTVVLITFFFVFKILNSPVTLIFGNCGVIQQFCFIGSSDGKFWNAEQLRFTKNLHVVIEK